MEPTTDEIRAAMAVRDLMSATQTLFELSASKTRRPLVEVEMNDIRLAYTHLGRMISQMKQVEAA